VEEMKLWSLRIGTVGFGLATALALSISAQALPPPAVQEHLDRAKELAGDDPELQNTIGLMCTQIGDSSPLLAPSYRGFAFGRRERSLQIVA
jgi:hypothetical protein